MRALLVIQFLSFAFGLTAQDNWVRNPDFEHNALKKEGIHKLKKDRMMPGWWSRSRAKPLAIANPDEYIAKPVSGKIAMGLVLGSRWDLKRTTYLSGDLKQPLRSGETYCVCFNLLLHRTSQWAATDVGLLLHHDKDLLSTISDPTTVNATLYANGRGPVANTKWQTFCGYYEASGGERYLSFGKFGQSKTQPLDSLNLQAFPAFDGYQYLAFYQLDDISVTPVTAGEDCGCAEPLPDPPVISYDPPPFLFTLDASNSMNQNGLFDTLRETLTEFVEQLPDGSPVSFVTFASTAQQLFAGQKEQQTATKVNQALSSTPVKGTTNVLAGLQLAYASLPVDVPDSARLVFISDGLFRVTPPIVALVQEQYERYGRKLILLQIGSRAIGLENLSPFLETYLHTTTPEVSQVIRSIGKESMNGIPALSCPCIDTYPSITNYHFVVDYSGSMLEENSTSLKGLETLYDAVPDSAMVSVTLFNHNSMPIYLGERSEFSFEKLKAQLAYYKTRGGTKPIYGIKNAIIYAEQHSDNRLNAIIIITDLSSLELTWINKLRTSLATASDRFELAVSGLHFFFNEELEQMQSQLSQYDPTEQIFFSVTREKFERDLFYRDLEKCDYRSQPHYRGKPQGIVKTYMQEVQREYSPDEHHWE